MSQPNPQRRRLSFPVVLVASALLVAGAASGAVAQSDDPTANVDPASLVPAEIVGPSQAGDLASDPAEAWLTDEECEAAKEAAFKIGIVMQTMNIQWSTEQVRASPTASRAVAVRSSLSPTQTSKSTSRSARSTT